MAINGFGRIGRCVGRIAANDPDIDLVAINDLTSIEDLAYLFRNDSVHGRYGGTVSIEGEDKLLIDGDELAVYSERDPADLPWEELGVDYVLECTGVFRKREDAAKHLEAGASFVLISAPGKGVDLSVVMGVNESEIDVDEMQIIDVASCTTNCLAPVAKVLHDEFGLAHGLMTTVHAYTSSQSLIDAPHKKDPRRGRAAAVNMVPTTTGAAVAVTRVLPELEGRLDGMAIRVPTPSGSCVDLVARLEQDVTVEQINAAFEDAANGPLEGILGYTEEPLVSTDILTDSHSSIVDAGLTRVIGDDLVKIISWYDNEWGYSSRMVDVLKYVDGQRNG
jgi:glyceraldehyde 3-phosphate dehydrogenase